MRINNISSQFVGYDFLKRKETQKYVEENQEVKNDYFQCSNEYQGKDSIGRRLDLTYLLTSDDGFLSGSLSDENDADYYHFSIASFRNLNMVEKYNKDIVINLEDIPAGCQYEIILYDKEGNQVGIGMDNENGGKSICVPNWDNSTEFYVKVFSLNGSEDNKHYHLSFDVLESTEECGAYLQNQEKSKYLADFRYKLHAGEDYSKEKAALEAIDEKYRDNYYERMDELHKQQAKDFNINGDEDVKQLLDRYAEGKKLSEEEKKVLMVYTNAHEHDIATITRELNEKVMSAINAGLEEDISGDTFLIQVEKNGEISVTGGIDEKIGKKIRKILGEKFSDLLWESYILISEETERMSDEECAILENYVEVESFLYRISGGKLSLDDIKVKEYGYIDGLPEKAGNMINKGVNSTYQAYAEKIRYLKNISLDEYSSSIHQCTAKYIISNNYIRVLDESII